ncbi:MAG: ATP-grasp domain-containing protein [Mogibacterium sp.]|nr:ATP-grasp domain-containing protein [Mogibacterium sp.]
MKKIMILGAGIYQVPLIKKAKDMGLYTIVLSIPGDYPGFELADKTYYCNTSDKVSALEIAQNEKIDAICTTGTDVAVSTIGYVNSKMGLCGITEDAANCTTDKVKMQKAFHGGGVNAAEYVVVRTAEEAVEAAKKIGFPVVVKCVDSSGSRGITTVFEEKDVAAAFEESIKYSRQDYVLVEQRLTGHELCISGFVQKGKVAFLAPHHKYSVKKNNIPISIGHSFPYHCDQRTYDNIAAEMQKVVDATGIDSCAFNADAFDDDGEISIIEVGGRAGATCIPELIAIHYGVDYYKMVIENALGNTYDVSIKEDRVPCKARLLMSPVDGTITDIDEDKLESMRGEYTQIQLDFPAGHAVEEMINGTCRIGHVIAPTDDETEHNKIVDAVYDSIYVDNKSLKELWTK